MTATPLAATRATYYVPGFEVEINGRPAHRGLVRDITEVTYEDSLDSIDSFTLVLNNHDTDRGLPQFVGQGAPENAWDQVQPGNGLRLSLGYQGDLRLMLIGYITRLDVEFPESGASRLTIGGLNILDRFRDRQYTWAWPYQGDDPIRDSDIARDLGQTPGSPDGHPGLAGLQQIVIDDAARRREQPREHVFMNNQFPIVFLLQLARRNGYEIVLQFVDDQPQLYFGPSQDIRDITYLLEWGKTLTSLKASVSSARQVKKLTVVGWNRDTHRPVRGEATVDSEGVTLDDRVRALARATGREEVVTDYSVTTDAAAAQLARQRLTRHASRLVEVEGQVVGLPDLRAGRTVELGRLGPHLDGSYLITSTRHVLNDSGYRTTFRARLEGAASGTAAPPSAPSTAGGAR